MKIILVTLQYSYGQESRGIDYISIDGFLKSFQRCGHTTQPFFYDAYLNSKDRLQSDLLTFVQQYKPDLIFFTLYTDQFAHETLNYLKAQYRTVAWFGDDTWRFETYSKHLANCFTYCVTTDKLALPKYRSLGQVNVILSQWAAIDNHKVPRPKAYKYDVSFIGGYSESRDWFINELAIRGISVAVFGQGWPRGPLNNAEMNQLFAETKINLNLSNSMPADYRFFFFKLRRMPFKRLLKRIVKSYFNPGKFFRGLAEEKQFSQIKARHFEIPYFGGFQLSYFDPHLSDYFVIGEEIACFGDIDNAADLIRYYLENEKEREQVKNRGCKRSRKEHGYTHRLRRILQEIRHLPRSP